MIAHKTWTNLKMENACLIEDEMEWMEDSYEGKEENGDNNNIVQDLC